MPDWVTSPSTPLQGLQSLNHTPQQGPPFPLSHQLLKPTTQDKTTLTQVLLSETRVKYPRKKAARFTFLVGLTDLILN